MLDGCVREGRGCRLTLALTYLALCKGTESGSGNSHLFCVGSELSLARTERGAGYIHHIMVIYISYTHIYIYIRIRPAQETRICSA